MMPTFLVTTLTICAAASSSSTNALSETQQPLVVSCAEDNDLYRVLCVNGISVQRFSEPQDAIQAAPENGSVLVLADGYPQTLTPVGSAFFEVAQAKRLRVYLEYPFWLPGISVGEPRHTHWERAVVASDIFGESLGELSILGIHDCTFLPVEAPESHIVVAKVAGLNRAIFGLPEQSWPILFKLPEESILVATTKLSQFITARYAPTRAWKTIWQTLLGWIQPDGNIPALDWLSTVRPSYDAGQELPADAEIQAFTRGINWFQQSRLLVHESWYEQVPARQKGYHDGVGPVPDAAWPTGDGSQGFLEGYSSTIHSDGTQSVRYYLRNDCNGEVSMGLAFGSALLSDPYYATVSANLNDFIRFNAILCQGPRNDPASPSYGLHGWDTRPEVGGSGNYYGDDNARGILGTIAAAALLKSDRWDEPILRNLLANLRTTGIYGFRQASLLDTMLQENGWEHYLKQPTIHYAPHYQAYLWATFLWAYAQTGYEPFLTRPRQAIGMTMQAYPDRWRWTNGIQQERARLLLPLAWLVRVDDTEEHREWLHRIATDMLASQAPCGAIREELGKPGMGSYPPPASNEAYGTSEASLISQNGDPICDLLYTTNFAFLGLHEAAAATGDPQLCDAEDRLAAFLCRIQVRSEQHPELDGAWFRAFDFERWDYWGSNADAGWGAWSIESGWTQGWIVSVLAMRQMDVSFWDLTADSQIAQYFETYRTRMLPETLPEATEKEMQHADH